MRTVLAFTMSMADYEMAIAELTSKTGTNDADFGVPCDDSAVEVVELGLGIQFTPIFRRFLREHSGAAVNGTEIFGVLPDKPHESPLLVDNLKQRQAFNLPASFILIAFDELGDLICLDHSPADLKEASVIRYFPEKIERVAVDFGDYLLNRTDGRGLGLQQSTSIFDPPFGYEQRGGQLVAHRKEVKIAGMIVQRSKYDDCTWKAIVKELNSRKIPARNNQQWTQEAVMEVCAQWRDKY